MPFTIAFLFIDLVWLMIVGLLWWEYKKLKPRSYTDKDMNDVTSLSSVEKDFSQQRTNKF